MFALGIVRLLIISSLHVQAEHFKRSSRTCANPTRSIDIPFARSRGQETLVRSLFAECGAIR